MKTNAIALPGLLLAVGLTCVPTVSAQNISISPISSEPGVYLVHTDVPGTPAFNMNNLLLVRPDSVLLVDTLPPSPLGPVFLGAIHSRTNQHVDTLINTHWHFDHVGLDAYVKQYEGTESLIAHWKVDDSLTATHCLTDLGLCPQEIPYAKPTQFVHGVMTLLRNTQRITLKTFDNAHSGVDLFVYLEDANLMYTGDLYFGGMYPIIDRTGGGTVNGMLHALHEILERIDQHTIVIPSHGVLGDRRSVREFARMLETSRNRVRALMARGFTETQVMVHPSFADLDAQWGNGFISGPLFRLIVYRDLAAHSREDDDHCEDRDEPGSAHERNDTGHHR